MQTLTIPAIQADPGCIATQAVSRTGLEFTIRPLTPRDEAVAADYFLSVSEDLKAVYGPHPFDRATAQKICIEAGDPAANYLRLIGVLPDGRVIAYFILELRVPEHEIERYRAAGVTISAQDSCRVAPSVLDAYQSQGVGAPMMAQALAAARQLGFRHVVLMEGVLGHNERARHFYRKMGFREVAPFMPTWENPRLSYDMMVDL